MNIDAQDMTISEIINYCITSTIAESEAIELLSAMMLEDKRLLSKMVMPYVKMISREAIIEFKNFNKS